MNNVRKSSGQCEISLFLERSGSNHVGRENIKCVTPIGRNDA